MAKSSLSLRSSSFSLCHCRPTFSQRSAAASLQHDTRVRAGQSCGGSWGLRTWRQVFPRRGQEFHQASEPFTDGTKP